MPPEEVAATGLLPSRNDELHVTGQRGPGRCIGAVKFQYQGPEFDLVGVRQRERFFERWIQRLAALDPVGDAHLACPEVADKSDPVPRDGRGQFGPRLLGEEEEVAGRRARRERAPGRR